MPTGINEEEEEQKLFCACLLFQKEKKIKN